MDKLISLLYEDSSLSVEELSAMLGESEESIEKRIAEYKKSGVILGKKTFINWDKVESSGVTALIELKVTPQKETGFDEIAARISEFDEVDTVNLKRYKENGVVLTDKEKDQRSMIL